MQVEILLDILRYLSRANLVDILSVSQNLNTLIQQAGLLANMRFVVYSAEMVSNFFVVIKHIKASLSFAVLGERPRLRNRSAMARKQRFVRVLRYLLERCEGHLAAGAKAQR
jgi:hypothetical protein